VLKKNIAILSGGFSIVPVSAVYFGLQVLWLVKMYASAYPTSITVRGSNVYEERSLGIYAGDEPEEDHGNEKQGATSTSGPGLLLSPMRVPLTPMSATSQVSRFSHASRRGIDKIVGFGRESTAMVGRQIQRRMTGFHGVGVAPVPGAKKFNVPQLNQPGQDSDSNTVHSMDPGQASPDLVAHHVRSQLSHDVWWIALAFFIITIIETSHTLADPAAFSLFNILFEIVSAYANNGVTIGLPTAAFSFSGGWHSGSKLVLVLVMLRGRHRDLPVALDRAVKLPSLDLDDKEEGDAEIRRTMSRTPMSRSVCRF
jgi:Trk-type K+ transport system membrane component